MQVRKSRSIPRWQDAALLPLQVWETALRVDRHWLTVLLAIKASSGLSGNEYAR
jgi:hypothetical protein